MVVGEEMNSDFVSLLAAVLESHVRSIYSPLRVPRKIKVSYSLIRYFSWVPCKIKLMYSPVKIHLIHKYSQTCVIQWFWHAFACVCLYLFCFLLNLTDKKKLYEMIAEKLVKLFRWEDCTIAVWFSWQKQKVLWNCLGGGIGGDLSKPWHGFSSHQSTGLI